jgi:hypothetical protein
MCEQFHPTTKNLFISSVEQLALLNIRGCFDQCSQFEHICEIEVLQTLGTFFAPFCAKTIFKHLEK